MSRNIKFRAWDKKNKTMAYSDDGNQEYGWFTDNDGCMICVRIEEKRDIKLNNIMQYIGFKDKKGKEIYEGDIIRLTERNYTDCSMEKLESTRTSILLVAHDYGAFGLRENTKSKGLRPFIWLIGTDYDIEVIGNIHENPKLLERD
ncbi:YopX family protein [Clostridium hydrogenum]|uniref:YopX family protein n=1 Tax=Clostridium hydrogenum TaxID=2855764 RepID=UPI001F33E750|nr:YopX family protein [Clostridium hydrogenum]